MSTTRILSEQILTIQNGCNQFNNAAGPKSTINAGMMPTAEPMHIEIEIDSPYDAADGQGTAGWLAHPLPLPLLSKKNQYYWRSKRRGKSPALNFSTLPKPGYFLTRQLKPVSVKPRKSLSAIKPLQKAVDKPSFLPLAKILDNSTTFELRRAPALTIRPRHYHQWPQPVYSPFSNRKLPNSYTSTIAQIFTQNKSKTLSANHKVFSFFKAAAKPQAVTKTNVFSNKLNNAQRPVPARKPAAVLPKVKGMIKPNFAKNAKQSLAANRLRAEKLNYPDFTLFLIANENTAPINKMAAEHKPAAASLSYPDFSLRCFNSARSDFNAANAPQTTNAALNYPDLFLHAPNGIYSGTFFKAAMNNQPHAELNYADYSQHCAAPQR